MEPLVAGDLLLGRGLTPALLPSRPGVLRDAAVVSSMLLLWLLRLMLLLLLWLLRLLLLLLLWLLRLLLLLLLITAQITAPSIPPLPVLRAPPFALQINASNSPPLLVVGDLNGFIGLTSSKQTKSTSRRCRICTSLDRFLTERERMMSQPEVMSSLQEKENTEIQTQSLLMQKSLVM